MEDNNIISNASLVIEKGDLRDGPCDFFWALNRNKVKEYYIKNYSYNISQISDDEK